MGVLPSTPHKIFVQACAPDTEPADDLRLGYTIGNPLSRLDDLDLGKHLRPTFVRPRALWRGRCPRPLRGQESILWSL